MHSLLSLHCVFMQSISHNISASRLKRQFVSVCVTDLRGLGTFSVMCQDRCWLSWGSSGCWACLSCFASRCQEAMVCVCVQLVCVSTWRARPLPGSKGPEQHRTGLILWSFFFLSEMTTQQKVTQVQLSSKGVSSGGSLQPCVRGQRWLEDL